MEICFENKTISTCRELCRLSRVIQETAESVVPDVNDDIGRIASVQTSLFLKSKDVTARGVTVTGEACATLLYITESSRSVSFLRLTKAFTMDFEGLDTDADVQAQIKLRIQHTEARVLNPRKVMVGFEIIGELSCYAAENIVSESLLPARELSGLHAGYEVRELNCVKAVIEKTFAISEQYIFPGGKPSPDRIVSHRAQLSAADAQVIGSKIIVKGNVDVSVCYLSDDATYPLKAEFNSPFSQIIDAGAENIESCCAFVELTSAYCDLIDTIGGEKAVDVELHALIQLTGSRSEKLSLISDVYSNLMPSECHYHKRQFNQYSAPVQLKLAADERIKVADDCADVLSVFTALSQLGFQSDKLSAAVTMDIIYKSSGGDMSAVRRLVSLEADCPLTQPRLVGMKISDAYLRPDGGFIDAHILVDVSAQSCGSIELSRVESVTLDEERAYDSAEFPTLNLVRVGKESLWELAKLYHSSVERIAELNELEGGLEGKMLLIPKSI